MSWGPWITAHCLSSGLPATLSLHSLGRGGVKGSQGGRGENVRKDLALRPWSRELLPHNHWYYGRDGLSLAYLRISPKGNKSFAKECRAALWCQKQRLLFERCLMIPYLVCPKDRWKNSRVERDIFLEQGQIDWLVMHQRCTSVVLWEECHFKARWYLRTMSLKHHIFCNLIKWSPKKFNDSLGGSPNKEKLELNRTLSPKSQSYAPSITSCSLLETVWMCTEPQWFTTWSRSWIAKQLDVFRGKSYVIDKTELTEPHDMWFTCTLPH